MIYYKVILKTLILIILGSTLSACENTSVSGSISYGMGMGYGYPMYYGPRGYNSNIIVVAPPRTGRPNVRPPINTRPQPVQRPQKRRR